MNIFVLIIAAESAEDAKEQAKKLLMSGVSEVASIK